MADGEKVRQVLGHEDSRKSVYRELQEIAVGAPVDFVEARTKQLLKEGSWGKWDTCDDLPPPPTGFKDGHLTYDGDQEAAARLDLIGLQGPESLALAEAGTAAAPKVTPNGADHSQGPTETPASKEEQDVPRAPDSRPKANGTDDPQPDVAKASAPGNTDGSSKGSFFQSLKSKIYA